MLSCHQLLVFNSSFPTKSPFPLSRLFIYQRFSRLNIITNQKMATGLITSDVLVLPFFGQGHLFPCVELCKNLSSSRSSYHCTPILIIPSHLSSSIPSNLHLTHPSIQLLQIPSTSNTPTPPPQLGFGIESFLSERYKNGARRPSCVVMDVMMSWSKDIFKRENIPIVSFFTSGACSTAMEYAAWKARAGDMTPGETRMLSGLPDTMALSYSDLLRRDQGHHHRSGGGGGGRGRSSPGGMNIRPSMQGRGGPPGRGDFSPPVPGQQPRWLEEAEASTALLINTCDDLEGPFLTYLEDQIGKPVLGVGPLLPESYWGAAGAILHDRDSRPDRQSNRTEDEVIQWLDSKPPRSVIYVSFGSEVGPTMEEYDQLADALRESNVPFIWVIQPGSGKPGRPNKLFGGSSASEEEGYYPKGLEEEVADRGLLIKGWAPQLILSHTSTGGFLSHCGWNSTMEAIARGIPILAWPIRGDQYYNAKLVVDHLRVGCKVWVGDEKVKKGDIMGGIQKLMEDREVHGRAMVLKGVFEGGYPSCSGASLKTLLELVSK